MVALLAAGCGSQVSGAPAPSTVGDASRVDMCTILTAQELISFGTELDTRKPVNRLGSVGCTWLGTRITLDLERDKETLASYRARRNSPTFTSFMENAVNGRPGAHLSVDPDQDDCTQVMDGGPVSLSVSVAEAGDYKGPPIDSCAEAMRISQMIEPRIPKAGS
jgi:hypothetical protein